MVVYLKDMAWERSYGPIPAGLKVSQRDGNKSNLAPNNLCLVPESEYPGDDGQLSTELPAKQSADEARPPTRPEGDPRRQYVKPPLTDHNLGTFPGAPTTAALAYDLCARLLGGTKLNLNDEDFASWLQSHRDEILVNLSKDIPLLLRQAMIDRLEQCPVAGRPNVEAQLATEPSSGRISGSDNLILAEPELGSFPSGIVSALAYDLAVRIRVGPPCLNFSDADFEKLLAVYKEDILAGMNKQMQPDTLRKDMILWAEHYSEKPDDVSQFHTDAQPEESPEETDISERDPAAAQFFLTSREHGRFASTLAAALAYDLSVRTTPWPPHLNFSDTEFEKLLPVYGEEILAVLKKRIGPSARRQEMLDWLYRAQWRASKEAQSARAAREKQNTGAHEGAGTSEPVRQPEVQ